MKLFSKNLMLFGAFNLFFMFSVAGQKLPMKWGKISKEDIDLKTCELDTSANAVVLCDYGEIWFIPGQPLKITRHKRIKILKKQGISEQADVSISYYNAESMENVDDVEAQTINVGSDGKTTVVKIEKNKIYDVDEDKNWKAKRFSFPSVEVGSIIEYSYKLYSKYYISPKEWYFQCEIPTLHSEYRAKIEQGLDVRYFLRGTQLQHVYGGTQSNTFALGYLHAIKDEPYCPNPQDYVEKVTFQLAGYNRFQNNDPAQGIERVELMTTWEKLAIDLKDDENFTSFMKKKQLAKEFLENNLKNSANLNKREKVEAIYKVVSQNFKWNGKYSLNMKQTMKELLESKTGSGIELNMLLITMLQAAELDANPALMSTKSHGSPTADYPLINQYNHVLCHVKLFEDDLLLDATDPFRPYDLLATEHLNPNVFIASVNSPRLINPKQAPYSKSQISLLVDSITDSHLLVKTRFNANNYIALQLRKAIQKADKVSEVVNDFLFPDDKSVQSDSCIVENQNDISKTLSIVNYFKLEKDDGGNDGYIYIKPLIGLSFPKFIAEKRYLPVDFYYRREYSQTFILKIPAGYELIDMPEQQNITLLKDDASFKSSVKNENSVLSFRIIYKLNRTLFYPSEYEALKEFYNTIEKAVQTTVVLKKK